MRRISTGVQGRTVLGNFVAETNRFTTRGVNQNIVLEPDGIGQTQVEGDLKLNSLSPAVGGPANLVFESLDGGAVRFEVGDTGGNDYTLRLPSSAPNNGQVIIADSSGFLSFQDINLPVSNQTADTATYYPLMSTSSSGDITGVTTTTGKLEFQPSSGKLTVTDGEFADLTVTGDFEAGTITETSSIVLKTDIEPIANALDSISALAGVSYTRRATGRRESGLIAEEVEKIAPELVMETGDYKSISYSRLTAYLIEAVKDLRSELVKIQNG